MTEQNSTAAADSVEAIGRNAIRELDLKMNNWTQDRDRFMALAEQYMNQASGLETEISKAQKARQALASAFGLDLAQEQPQKAPEAPQAPELPAPAPAPVIIRPEGPVILTPTPSYAPDPEPEEAADQAEEEEEQEEEVQPGNHISDPAPRPLATTGLAPWAKYQQNRGVKNIGPAAQGQPRDMIKTADPYSEPSAVPAGMYSFRVFVPFIGKGQTVASGWSLWKPLGPNRRGQVFIGEGVNVIVYKAGRDLAPEVKCSECEKNNEHGIQPGEFYMKLYTIYKNGNSRGKTPEDNWKKYFCFRHAHIQVEVNDTRNNIVASTKQAQKAS